MNRVTLKPGATTLLDLKRIYRGAAFELSSESREIVRSSAKVVEDVVSRGEPVYGINTGFGKLATVRIGSDELGQLQRNLVLSHAVGVGDPTPPRIVRLMIALKLASLAQGASGVRWQVIEALHGLIELGILPIIPQQGSVGASGDLAPLAHMAACLLGEGMVDVAGEKMTAAQGLKQFGMRPVQLSAKEGLALLNGTQFSTAYALAALFEADELFCHCLAAGALTTDAAKGSDGPFDERIHRLRPHRGQIETARALRELLTQSEIRASHLVGDERVQDPYCLRCQPQVLGAVFDQLAHCARILEIEANSVSDNPLVLVDEGAILSGGNFHAEPVAMAADVMAIAICELGTLSERRIAMLVDTTISGLPPFLSPQPGLNSGFMMAQVTAAALSSENKQLAYPASVDSIPTSANQEDHVSMAAHAARRLMPMIKNARTIVAIELLAAAQGCDFHAPLKSSPPLEALRGRIRALVRPWKEDRFFHPDILAISNLLESGVLTDNDHFVKLPTVLQGGKSWVGG